MPLVLAAYFQDEGLDLDLDFDLGLYTEAAARRLLSDCGRLLAGIVEHLDRSPLRVPMLDAALREQLTVTETERELRPDGPSAIERFFERAALAPGATAVKELGGGEIGYAELERRVRRLAGVLRARGVAPGVFVGVLLPRSIDAAVALLAVHAAGGAFVPLDPEGPLQRLDFMVRDSGAKLVLVSRTTRGRLKGTRDIELDIDDPAARAAQDARLACLPSAGEPRLRDLHLGVDGSAQGRVRLPRSAGEPCRATLDRFALGRKTGCCSSRR